MIEKIYSTELFIERLPEINTKYLKNILLEKESEEKSEKMSNIGGWQGKGVLQFDRRFSSLIMVIGEYFETVIKKELNYRSDIVFQIQNMWGNVNRQGDINSLHVHPGADWSFCVYINTADSCGDIIIQDPRIRKDVICDHWAKKDDTPYQVSVEPAEGMLIVFPSYMMHEVESNKSTEPRISISGNIRIKSNILGDTHE